MTPSTVGRVVAGLSALYTFNEGSGTIVHDRSNVGPPLDLLILAADKVTWLNGGGLALNAPTVLRSLQPATKLSDACKLSDAITIEAWIKPANTTQNGPAAIVSYGQDPKNRNMTLAQGLWGKQPGSLYTMRVRTDKTNKAGGSWFASAKNSLTTVRTHIAAVRDSSGVFKLYRNGVQLLAKKQKGRFATWNSAYNLTLGAEANGVNPWLGEYQLVAIYCRALSVSELVQNYQAGTAGAPATAVQAAVFEEELPVGQISGQLLQAASGGDGSAATMTAQPLPAKVALSTTVTLVDAATGGIAYSETITLDEQGYYRFEELPWDDYLLSVDTPATYQAPMPLPITLQSPGMDLGIATLTPGAAFQLYLPLVANEEGTP